MRRFSRKSLFVALAICCVVATSLILVSRYQNYRINKIDFIIWDNQNGNVANLSAEQFTDYLLSCGAHIESSAPQWRVRYDGLFYHRTWTFSFHAPVEGISH
jgi:hypothetical protein